MRLSSPGVARPEWYDRNATWKGIGSRAQVAEGAAAVSAGTYTVPSGKKALAKFVLLQTLIEVAATTTLNTKYVITELEFAPLVGTTRIFELRLHSNSVVAGDHVETSSDTEIFSVAGDIYTLRREFEGTAAGAGLSNHAAMLAIQQFDA